MMAVGGGKDDITSMRKELEKGPEADILRGLIEEMKIR